MVGSWCCHSMYVPLSACGGLGDLSPSAKCCLNKSVLARVVSQVRLNLR
jgi:hypothetical protein